jgi:hypothetical protein
MGEISDSERYGLNAEMREGAVELEGAENGEGIRQIFRQDRRALEAITDRETIVRRLKDLDGTLGELGGEDDAVHAVRQRVAEAHYKLASSPGQDESRWSV